MDVPTFVSIMAANIRKNFAGDPLQLTPFVASIEFLEEIATTEALKTLLKKFILTKLEGFASEIVPNNVESIESIITILKKEIKPESSEVIAGRMMALRSNRTNLQDFQKQVEDLADALRRSLISAKMPRDLAEREVIKKTKELCRANTQNVTVISVLEATKFENPKEVVACFVIESNKTQQEAQILSLRQFQNRNFRDRSNYNQNQRGNHTNERFAHSDYRQCNDGDNRANSINVTQFEGSSYSNAEGNNFDTYENEFEENELEENAYDDENEYENEFECEENNEFNTQYSENHENDNEQQSSEQNYDCPNAQVLNINISASLAKDFVNVKTNVSNELTSALVDSQGDICLIKRNALKEHVKINTKIRYGITGVTDGSRATLGAIFMTMKIGKTTITHIFHVVHENFPIVTDALLGSDFLRKHECVIDYAKSLLTIQNEQIRLFNTSKMSTISKKMSNSYEKCRKNKPQFAEAKKVNNENEIQKILNEQHKIHEGRNKIYNKIRKMYFWKGMAKDISQMIKNCTECKTRFENVSTEIENKNEANGSNPWFRKQKQKQCPISMTENNEIEKGEKYEPPRTLRKITKRQMDNERK